MAQELLIQFSGGSRSVAKEMRALKMRSIVASHYKLTRTTWEHHQSWLFYKYTRRCWRTQRQPFYRCAAFEAKGKGEKAWQVGASCCHSVAQLCPTLCDPMDCIMPGFPVFYHLLELKLKSIKLVMPLCASWADHKSKNCHFEVSFSPILHNKDKPFLDQIVMKHGFYTTAGDNQLSGWTKKKFLSTSKSQTCTKKGS